MIANIKKPNKSIGRRSTVTEVRQYRAKKKEDKPTLDYPAHVAKLEPCEHKFKECERKSDHKNLITQRFNRTSCKNGGFTMESSCALYTPCRQ